MGGRVEPALGVQPFQRRGRLCQFCSNLADLDQINWSAVAARDFRRAEVKEGKRAEFLVHQSFPWNLVGRIGVYSLNIRSKVLGVLQAATYRPTVEVRPEWYY